MLYLQCKVSLDLMTKEHYIHNYSQIEFPWALRGRLSTPFCCDRQHIKKNHVRLTTMFMQGMYI